MRRALVSLTMLALALPAPALAALVPEPGALIVLASICALASRRRRRERG